MHGFKHVIINGVTVTHSKIRSSPIPWSLNLHSNPTQHPLNTHSIPTRTPLTTPLNTHSIPTRTPFNTHSNPTQYPLETHSIPTQYPLDPHSIPTRCSLNPTEFPVTLLTKICPAARTVWIIDRKSDGSAMLWSFSTTQSISRLEERIGVKFSPNPPEAELYTLLGQSLAGVDAWP